MESAQPKLIKWTEYCHDLVARGIVVPTHDKPWSGWWFESHKQADIAAGRIKRTKVRGLYQKMRRS